MSRALGLLRSYLVCAVVFVALDAVWLTLASDRLYRAELGPLMAAAPRLGPAVAFYLIYLAGVVGFCVAPTLRSGDRRQALVRGAAFGFVAYATYDLTNQATLIGWSARVTVLDLLWGAFVTAVSAGAAAFFARPSDLVGRSHHE